MRRKNMLALGLSIVLGVGASSTLAYALPLEQEESLQTGNLEEKNAEKTASNTETVTEEDAKKDSKEDSSAVEEMEASDKEKEEAEEESSLSTEALGGTDRAAEETLTPLSRSRRALADTPRYASEEEEKKDRRNKVKSVGVEFDNTMDVAGRDHMKVIREIPLKVNSYAIGIAGASYDYTQFRIQPKRVVEKKEGNDWTVYNLDYFTPGIYRYVYILEIVKGSPLYLEEGEINGEKKITAEVHIDGRFANGVHNNSNSIAKIIPLETDSSVGRKYRMEGREFAVEKEETISKVYLKSNLDIYNIHAGDLMKRITLSLDKMELTDGTVVMNSDTNMPLLVNTMKDYSDNLQQYKVRLYSYKNEEGYIGAVFNITESKPYAVGLYHSYFLIRPNYKIGKYRFLVNNTDDDYGSGTKFYINNELYKTDTVGIQRELTTQAYLQSPKFEVKKAENSSNTNSGNSASSSRGNSGSSSVSSSFGGSSSGSGGSGGSSGGGFGSFKVSSSFTGQVLGVDRSLSGGQWMQDEKGWWYKRPDGSYPKNSWGYEAYNGKSYWYYFLDSGYMATGWVDVNGSKYYLFPNSDGWKGRMLTGWQWIDGNCYYLDLQGQNEGALYRNTTTPDGFTVDSEGRWVVNGVVQKQ
ncbi:N-acetylmuramoyl-L-alanine amidase family protein [Oribacterium sinus]|nr:hypothetical protein [Oribacterium sinus]